MPCYLQWKKADDHKETYDCDMQILDENGSVLYEYLDMGSSTMRGILQKADMIWGCAEQWLC